MKKLTLFQQLHEVIAKVVPSSELICLDSDKVDTFRIKLEIILDISRKVSSKKKIFSGSNSLHPQYGYYG